MAKPSPFRSILLTALIGLGTSAAGRAQADASKATPATAADPTVFTDPAKAAASADAKSPVSKPARPKRDRAMSDDLAATLAVGMPKYSPPPKPVEKTPEELAAAAEADKPRNGIIRLPDYVVREARPPVFKEKDLATPGGKTDLGIKQNPGLNFGPFASLNRPIGLMMYQEQERLNNMAELADDARTARRAGDHATADYIRKQSQQTYIRRDDQSPTYGLGPR